MQCVHRYAWEECVLLKGTRLVRQNADGIQRCATACTAWASLHMLKPVLWEQRDAVSQRNVGSCKASIHACAFILQSGLVEAGFHLGRERVGGWVQKRTKEGSNPQGMSLTKKLEAETATRPKIQPRLKHKGKDKPLALESWSLLQA